MRANQMTYQYLLLDVRDRVATVTIRAETLQ